MSRDLAALVDRLQTVTTRLEGLAARGGSKGGAAPDELSELVEEFDSQVLAGKFKTYLEISEKIGGDVAQQAKKVEAAFQTQRAFLVVASKHKRPQAAKLPTAMKPVANAVEQVQAYCDAHRTSKVFNHLMTVKEGIGCLGWITVSPKPGPYVKEMYNQSLFYGNRVIKDYKGKEDIHVEWMRSFTGAIQELETYVRSFHLTGLSWNPSGPELADSAAPPPPPPAGPAPPPPPPVQPPTGAAPSGAKGDGDDVQRAALFADLSRGGAVTSGLKKVTNDMKTHKNPGLRAGGVVKSDAIKKPQTTAAPKFGAAAAKKNPICELQNKKWVVEYQEDAGSLEITNTNMKQQVYVWRCSKTTIVVKGKVNSIVLDSCKRVALVLDDCISAVEVINCQGIQVQINGKVPTVSIDKTDGCQVYLSKQSLQAEIITAKSSEMNICIPPAIGSGDFMERAIPEQYKTRWNGKSLVTECTDING